MGRKDIDSKMIFKNPQLCAEFIRDNIDIPMLKNVCAEDIEDVSSDFQPFFRTGVLC